MRKGYLLAGTLLVFCFSAIAAPSCSTTSGSNNLIAYTGAGNVSGSLPSGLNSSTAGGTGEQDNPCSVNTLTFSNFSYDLNNGSFSTTAINLETGSPNGSTVNFDFNPNLNPNSDLQFEFEVTGGVTGINLSMNGPTGFVNETVCTAFTPDGNCADGGGTQIASIGVTAGNSNNSTVFAQGHSNIWIFKDINTGASGLSEVNQGFVVPEPMTLSLMGLGLLGIGLVGRRFRGQ